jgi:hypothetical protein
MRNFLINSALALTMGISGVPLLAGQASAQEFELSIGREGPQIRTRERCDPNYNDDCYEGRRYVEQREVRRGCSEGRALNKAERMGIRRARIVSAGRRTIEIRGRSFEGERVYVTFGRERGCPVLEY